MSRADRDHWDGHHARFEKSATPPPARFLAEHVSLLAAGRTLEIAAGSGRNALFLSARGYRVIACDASRAALEAIRAAKPEGDRIDLVEMDLDDPGFRPASVDNVVCVNVLDRRLFPEIERWLRPGGVLLFDTFLVDQRAVGHPKNPDFLLGRNELLDRLRGYRILRYREGEVSDGETISFRAGAVAVRP
jgi:SAM-dependent methyltransferase